MIEYAETSPLNSTEINDGGIGVITSGVAYQYAKEALGDSASYLKLGIVNPPACRFNKEFCEKI